MDAPPPKLLSNTLLMCFNTSSGKSQHQRPYWCSSGCLGQPQWYKRDTPTMQSSAASHGCHKAGRYGLEAQFSHTVYEWKETASQSHSRCMTCSTSGCGYRTVKPRNHTPGTTCIGQRWQGLDAPPPKLLSNTLIMLFNTSSGKSQHQRPYGCS